MLAKIYRSIFSFGIPFSSFLLGISVSAQTLPSGDWLDSDTNWNQAGMPIPPAPEQETSSIPDCQHVVRPAALPEDDQIVAAGWTLANPAQIYGATTLVTGMANADGMCRPMVYQVFVFTAGEFTGTLSPIPMDSRTDGSLVRFDLYREGSIDAVFNRYDPGDALCCGSGESRLFYSVERREASPLLIPQLPADTYERPTPQ